MSNVTQIQERFNEINTVILEWLKEQADFPVVMAESSDPRPDETHLSFKMLTNLIKLGAKDERIINKTTGKVTLRAHRQFTVAIEAIGNPVGPDEDLDDLIRATDILHAVHISLDQITVRDKFNAADLAIINEGTVTDISQLLETETEPRALLEIVLAARFDITDNPGYFDTVELTGDFDTDCDGEFDDYSTGVIQVKVS